MQTDQNILKLGRAIGLGLRESENTCIPKDYLNIEGFRLREEPRRRSKVLFLGAMEAWGEQELKIGPKVQWLFHESDQVIIHLRSPIVKDVPGHRRKHYIELRRFELFCESFIPEKVRFILGEGLIGSLGLSTIKYIESFGAHGAFSNEMLRLDQGLFLKSREGLCEVKAQKDLASIAASPGERRSIQMENGRLNAQGLGSFVSREGRDSIGIYSQIEFAQYEQWKIEKIRWEHLKQEASHGCRIIYS